MPHHPVRAEPLPADFHTQAGAVDALAAAQARARAVPAGPTLISRISAQEWSTPEDDGSIIAGTPRAR